MNVMKDQRLRILIQIVATCVIAAVFILDHECQGHTVPFPSKAIKANLRATGLYVHP